LDRLAGIEPVDLGETLSQGLAVDVLHDDERERMPRAPGIDDLVLPGVEDRDDVRVVEAGRRLRLAAEAQKEVLVTGEVRSQHLEGDLPTEPCVVAGVDVGHAATTDEAAGLVAAPEDAGCRAHALHLGSIPACVIPARPSILVRWPV